MDAFTPRVVDNDRDEITVTLDGKEIRGWSYRDESERRVKMLAAREFCEGWFQAFDAGRRDMLNHILALNPVVGERLAKLHGRDADPEGRLPFDVVFWVTEVAEQLGIEPKDDLARQPKKEQV